MMDISAGLNTFRLESGLTDGEEELEQLRARAAVLTFCGCAHAVFLCELLQPLRCEIKSHNANKDNLVPGEDRDLRIGILGMGHLGKQLLTVLLEKSNIKPPNIKISSRRLESEVTFIQAGIECFFDNIRLAAWADILFLCCLPSHLLKVCADLRSHLSKHCLVYSFTSGVSIKRLAHLLGHDFILKSQYDFVMGDDADVWQSCTHLTSALSDPLLIESSCPLTTRGGSPISLNWVCAVLYSMLNICTSAGVGSSDALQLIKSVLQDKGSQTVELKVQDFISVSYASSLLSKEPFPGFLSLMPRPRIHLCSASYPETNLCNNASRQHTNLFCNMRLLLHPNSNVNLQCVSGYPLEYCNTFMFMAHKKHLNNMHASSFIKVGVANVPAERCEAKGGYCLELFASESLKKLILNHPDENFTCK